MPNKNNEDDAIRLWQWMRDEESPVVSQKQAYAMFAMRARTPLGRKRAYARQIAAAKHLIEMNVIRVMFVGSKSYAVYWLVERMK